MRLLINKAGVTYTVLYDEQDHPLISKNSWCVSFMRSGKPRVESRINQKLVRLHRLIAGAVEKDQKADHINGNTLDNRRQNLRLVTREQNMQNLHGANKKNSTGVRGVCKRERRYIARATLNRKRIYVGSFSNLKDAENAIKYIDLKIFLFLKKIKILVKYIL